MNESPALATRPPLLSVAVAIIIGSISALVVNTLPVFLTVIARTRGLDESQSGLIAFAEMGGIAIGTITCALLPALVARLGWRRLAASGLSILIAANILAALVQSYELLLLTRALAGLGSGIAMAVTYAVLAQGDGARDLAIFNVVQLSAGWLGIPFLSPIAERFGVGGLFATIAVLAGLALLLCPALPRGQSAGSTAVAAEGATAEKVSPAGWLAIISVLFYFSGAGAIFAYLAFMGVAWGGAQAVVESQLSTIMFAAVMGGVTVALIGSRFGFRRPLYVGYALLLSAILLLATLQPVEQFLLLGCLFGFGWNIVTPYQFEAVTEVDSSSSAAMLVNASTLGGMAIGPAIAGYLATANFLQVNLLALLACVTSMVLLLTALRLHTRRAAPRFEAA